MDRNWARDLQACLATLDDGAKTEILTAIVDALHPGGDPDTTRINSIAAHARVERILAGWKLTPNTLEISRGG